MPTADAIHALLRSPMPDTADALRLHARRLRELAEHAAEERAAWKVRFQHEDDWQLRKQFIRASEACTEAMCAALHAERLADELEQRAAVKAQLPLQEGKPPQPMQQPDGA